MRLFSNKEACMLKNSKGLPSASILVAQTYQKSTAKAHSIRRLQCTVLFTCMHLYASTQDLIRNIKLAEGKHQRRPNNMLYVHQRIAFYHTLVSVPSLEIIMKCCIFHPKPLVCLLYEISITGSCHQAPSVTLRL